MIGIILYVQMSHTLMELVGITYLGLYRVVNVCYIFCTYYLRLLLYDYL